MKEYKVYQHLDEDGVCIYVGLTTNMNSRQTTHRSNSPHWYLVREVLVAEVENKTAMQLYEQYYINKLNPKYNSKDKRGDNVSGLQGLVELPFITYWKTNKNAIILPPKDIMENFTFRWSNNDRAKLEEYFKQQGIINLSQGVRAILQQYIKTIEDC